jgi:dTDP-4-dehydrorhamnose reductase
MGDEKIAILGGKGMLGRDVAAACGRHGFEPVVMDLPDFDITSERHVRAAAAGAGAIVNCAAYTNVEKAESEPDMALKVNGDAVGKLGQAASDEGLWVLHVSTDFVFDGESKRPYTESDPPNPINAYGRSKLAGERLLVESGCAHCIIRVEWTYGAGGDNFITKLVKKAKAGEKLCVVGDQFGSPTATTQIAEVICALLNTRPEGLFHYACEGYASRYDVAEFVFKKLDMAADLGRCETSDFPTAARRPKSSRFNCGKIKTLLDRPIERWQGPLERFLKVLER